MISAIITIIVIVITTMAICITTILKALECWEVSRVLKESIVEREGLVVEPWS